MFVSTSAGTRVRVLAAPAAVRARRKRLIAGFPQTLALGRAIEEIKPTGAIGYPLRIRGRHYANRLAGREPFDLLPHSMP
jgi:hypothetical protein